MALTPGYYIPSGFVKIRSWLEVKEAKFHYFEKKAVITLCLVFVASATWSVYIAHSQTNLNIQSLWELVMFAMPSGEGTGKESVDIRSYP